MLARQYGQYDLEKTTTEFSSMICWAFCFAADIATGEVVDCDKKDRARFRRGAKIEEAMLAVLKE